jgi:uncharacterized RDD family membrane protein YckC
MDDNAAPSPAAAEAADPKGAGPLLRAGSFAIDLLFVGAAAWLWDIGIWYAAPLEAPRLVPIGIMILVLVYYGWATARNHHTPGQGFAGLTLLRTDYRPLTARRACIRMLLFWATAGMVLPNLVIMLFDKKRRAIHDWLTKTWVCALPDLAPRRRRITLLAAWILIILSTARALLSLSDYLENRQTLTLEQVGAGVDGK